MKMSALMQGLYKEFASAPGASFRAAGRADSTLRENENGSRP